ncbi:MAG: SMC family ATPase [Clostridia bacterium]|nr:SMC family ATPase [Clostridia bacterium]
MKPVYLEFCGINSFSEKTEIDFRSLLAGGVFGIFGDTGSGKSTLLDCIHLALYGKIERSDFQECINYKLDSAYVIFDFELVTDGVRHTYRVKRERKRKNNTAKAFLYEYQEDKLLALAEGTKDVNERLETIIGLTFADFKTCIALPQGDFAALVKAPTSERVKLVSRLFDLEKYGERLFKSVSARALRADENVNLIKAKMGETEEGRGENLSIKKEELIKTEALLKKAEESLKTAEKAHEKASELKKQKTAYEDVKRRLGELSLRVREMRQKQAEVERYPYAQAVLKESNAVENNRLEKIAAQRNWAQAKEEYDKKTKAIESAKLALEEGGFEEKIVRVSLALEKVKGGQKELKAESEARKLYDAAREEYKKLSKLCLQENFDEELKDLQKKVEELGADESLLQYVFRNCKDLFMGESYGEFRKDLYALQEKFPQTEEEIAVLLQKYTPRRTDEKTLDMAQLQASFKLAEGKRKLLKSQLEEVEKRKRDYEANETKKQALAAQGAIYKATLDAATAKTAELNALGTLSDIEDELNALQKSRAAAQARVDTAQEAQNACFARMETQKGLYEKCVLAEGALKENLQKALQDNGFAFLDEAKSLIERVGDVHKGKEECNTFFERYAALQRTYEETDERAFADFDETALTVARETLSLAREERDRLYGEFAAKKSDFVRIANLHERYKVFEKELIECEKEKKTCEELKNLLKGNKFLEFIASEYLQEVCVGASKTLLSLTGGRYFLQYDKDFKVGDNLDGGNLRSVKTLSGGETFLVSLSLALSLSAAICIKSLRPIEFFFLDEGFGTLDEKLVDTVMDVLGKLGKQNLTVGLISHVEELKHRIDNKILVTGANESHGSRVHVERF